MVIMMQHNKVFNYYRGIGDTKSAMRVKKPFFLQQEPHQKDVRRKRRVKKLLSIVSNSNNR